MLKPLAAAFATLAMAQAASTVVEFLMHGRLSRFSPARLDARVNVGLVAPVPLPGSGVLSRPGWRD